MALEGEPPGCGVGWGGSGRRASPLGSPSYPSPHPQLLLMEAPPPLMYDPMCMLYLLPDMIMDRRAGRLLRLELSLPAILQVWAARLSGRVRHPQMKRAVGF